ncbi:MAG: 16S rRNA (guanine(527)-N(7))-methyltransferase RsmG [Candidatus Acidiferrales bacterium]
MSFSNKPQLTPALILNALEPFGFAASSREVDAIRLYVRILLQWNQKISLTGLSDPVEVVSRHFGESWFAAKFLDLETGRLADIGSGAGFPGLALKILRPRLEIVLVEQNKKKSAFLAEVARTLNLEGVSVVARAYEDWAVSSASLDFVAARALGQYPRLLKWALPILKPSGKVVLWLGDDESNYLQFKPGWSWKLPERIPGSARRQVLVGSPAIPDALELLRSRRS